jgi:hypothetical protein
VLPLDSRRPRQYRRRVEARQRAALAHAFAGETLALTCGWNRVAQRTSMTASDDRYVFFPAAAASTDYTANALNQYSAIDDGSAVTRNTTPTATCSTATAWTTTRPRRTNTPTTPRAG